MANKNPLADLTFPLIRRHTVMSPITSTGFPIVTLFKQGDNDYLIDIALVIPSSMVPPGQADLICTPSQEEGEPDLNIAIGVVISNSDPGPYIIFFSRYKWADSNISSINVYLKPANIKEKVKTTANITGVFRSTADQSPISISHTINSMSIAPSNTLAPCVAFNSNYVDIVLALPDLDTGIQSPAISALPIYVGDNNYKVLPILVQNVIFSNQAAKFSLFFAHYEHFGSRDSFNAVHARIDFGINPNGDPEDPGPRGTYAPPQMPGGDSEG